jgi:hypothetical protein
MSSPSEDNGTVSALRNFEHTCAAKGAKVFFSFAPVPSAYFNDPYNNRVIHKLVHIIKNRTNLPILNAPEDTVFPSTYFFDTPDHLKKEARLLRTQRLAKSLNQIGI